MNIININFSDTLQESVQEKQRLMDKLKESLASIQCSASNRMDVIVARCISSTEHEIPAGENRFTLRVVSLSDNINQIDSISLISLKSSLSILLANIHGSTPLLFHCRAFTHEVERATENGPSPINNANQTPENSHPIASPEEAQLMGEFIAETPKFIRKQWIVSESVAKQFDDAIGIIKHRNKIFQKWGFAKVDPNPRAIVCFYGKPGTGKSMAAHVLAAELGKQVLCAKYSQIESKYVGDAPKKLRAVFKAAEENDAVLFFDEADSFLGKRIENVTSGSDQAINSLRGEMLILLEDFQGVVIFATNLITNFDRAFESRILTKIEFELPNAEAREQMIMAKIPEEAPIAPAIGENEMQVLVELSEGFSGRTIRNAILMSFVKGARHSEECGYDCVRFADFREAFEEQKLAAETLDNLHGERVMSGQEIQIDNKGQKALAPIITHAISETGKE